MNTSHETVVDEVLKQLLSQGWTFDLSDEDEEFMSMELNSPEGNLVLLRIVREPAYEGGFTGVAISYLGEDEVEVFAELEDVNEEALLKAIQGAAQKDAELAAAGK